MTALHVVVPGTPQGQGRLTTYGAGRTGHSNAKTLLPWRALVGAYTRRAMHARAYYWGGTWPLTGPVELSLRFYMPKPRTVRRERPSVPPDLDHLCRAIGDALTKAGAVEDDARIVALHAAKFYPTAGHRVHMDRPGCVIDLSTVTEVTT
ncbi:MAG: RusA family crossover junction endodeoxyribonuclease [Actinomycetota bacterium]|nr:RusA family crossover junction endodeoxyribonuclease [Actinomycetota bacterium]